MSILTAASHQWATRPSDERFVSLLALQEHFHDQRDASRELVTASRKIEALPDSDNSGLLLRGPTGGLAVPSHWAFGQLAALAEAPAGYLRTIPSPVAADCINYGLRFKRDVEDVGLLLAKGEAEEPGTAVVTARAITGPRYGRIWNDDIVTGLVDRFGDGLSGDFRIPGEFGKAVEVTGVNTTLYGGDRDMFVFLADEEHRVSIPSRRDGQPGELARGFFVWNSEVGAATFGIATFLFDYVCRNRIVWGSREYKQVTIRHTPRAPVRWLDEVAPALTRLAQSSTSSITDAITAARAARIEDSSPDVSEFLAKRFGKRMPGILHDVAMEEEGRPIETIWDATCAVTAYARSLPHQDDRVALERKAGELLDLVAA